MRRYILLATAAALLSACNNEVDEVVTGYVPSTDAIAFEAVEIGSTTRASGELSTTVLKALPEGFGVFASYTGQYSYESRSVSPDFMYNQQVKWVNDSWSYSPVKYWPNNENDYVSFFAYAPYEATPQDDGRCIINMSKAIELGDPWINYRLPDKPWGVYNTNKYTSPQQIDLLYGVNAATNKPWFDQKKADYDVNETMTFTFHHALACVGDEIKIKLSDELSTLIDGYGKIYIKRLTIDYKNLTAKGRLVLNSNTTPNWKEVISGEVITTRTLVLNYDEEAGNVAGTFFPDAVKPDYTSTDDAGRLTYYNTITGVTTTATTISTGKGLFYIPLQASGMEAARAELTLEYQVINNTGNAYEGTATTSFPLDMSLDGKKQAIDITIKKGFTLGVLVYEIGAAATEPSYTRQQ